MYSSYMLKNLLQQWLKLIIDRPRVSLVFILLLTVFLGSGLRKLQSDNSIEFLMPKEEPVYLLGERANIAFLKSKTFIITSIEPSEGRELFSPELFHHVNEMVSELEEYKEFNLEQENARLDALVALGNAQIDAAADPAKPTESETGETAQAEQQSDLIAEDIEAQLDELILSGNGGGSSLGGEMDQLLGDAPENDLWDLDSPLPEDRFATPIRKQRRYDLSGYTPVSLAQIRAAMDPAASRQVDTVLNKFGLEETGENEPLDRKTFARFLNAWEEMYLFKSMEMVHTFMNPITGEDISGKNNELKPVDFIETEKGLRVLPQSKADFEAYQKKIEMNPLNKDLFYSTDGDGNVRALSFSLVLKSLLHYSKFSSYLWPLIRKYDREPVKMYSNGSIIVERFMDDFVQKDLATYMPLVLLIVIFTFYLNFRSLRGIVLPTLTVVVGAIWTMGLMGHAGIKVSLLVSILPPLLIAVGSSYSIHMFNQYMHELPAIANSASHKQKRETLLKCMTHISVTILLATLTTMISFLTLSISQVTSLRDFGMFAAAGSLFATLLSFVLIPAFLVLLKPLSLDKFSGEKKTNPVVVKALEFLAHLSLNHPGKVIAVFSFLFVIGVIGLFDIRPETAPMYNFRDDSYIRKSDDRLGELFNGTFANDLIIDSGRPGGAKDPEFLKFVEGVREWMALPEQRDEYNILSTISFGDYIKRMHMAFHNDDPAYFKIPGSARQITDYLEIFAGDDRNSDGRPDSFEQSVDSEYRRVNLVIRTGSNEKRLFSTAVNQAIEKRVLSYMKTLDNPQDNPGGYTWFMAGAGINISILADYIITSQMTSVILSLLIIGFITYLLFQSALASLVSIIPISFGISLVYGVMGYLQIPLDIPKAILSSVAIGIGIDDTIHFMKTLSHHLKSSRSLQDAIRKTYEEAGVAIMYTSLALIFGFSILTLSHFKPIFFLGILVAAVMIATTLGALLFLPALVQVLRLQIRNIELENGLEENQQDDTPDNPPGESAEALGAAQ